MHPSSLKSKNYFLNSLVYFYKILTCLSFYIFNEAEVFLQESISVDPEMLETEIQA